MKIRQGFVSNSSSSSFLIDKNKITPEQTDIIYNHYKIAQEMVRKGELVRCDKDREFDDSLQDYKSPGDDDSDYYNGYYVGFIELGDQRGYNAWTVKDQMVNLECSTDMANFDLPTFLLMMGISKEAIGPEKGE
jgi:hypothetical protein